MVVLTLQAIRTPFRLTQGSCLGKRQIRVRQSLRFLLTLGKRQTINAGL